LDFNKEERMINRFFQKHNENHFRENSDGKRTDKNPTHWLVAAIILSISGWFIYKKIIADAGSIGQMRFDFHLSQFFLSLASITLSILSGSWIWNKILEALGQPLPPLRAMYVHLISNFSKYIPGSIWPYFGKLLLATRSNILFTRALMSIFWEFAFIGLGGLAWLIISFPFCNYFSLTPQANILLGISGLMTLGILFYLFPSIMNGFSRIIKIGKRPSSEAFITTTDWRKIRLLLFYVFLGWGFLLAGFILLIPFPTLSPLHLGRISFAFVSSILVGLIIFFVPLGLGIREAILINLLSTDFKPLLLIEISILFRLEFIVGEAISILLILAMLKWGKGLSRRSGEGDFDKTQI
jgi:glycosyltransferase 2 family protein